MELKECPDCTHKISVTAISCPVCGWLVPIEENTSSDTNISQKVGKAGVVIAGTAAGAIVIAALGPAAIAGGIASLLVPSGVNIKGVRKKAKKIGAIDGFRLSAYEMALVTEKALWTVDGRGANREIPLEELTNVKIDGSKIKRKKVFRDASATITLTFKCRKLFGGFYDAPNDYENTGDNSLDIVKYAHEKLQEYLLNNK